jgi:hypothetical protein
MTNRVMKYLLLLLGLVGLVLAVVTAFYTNSYGPVTQAGNTIYQGSRHEYPLVIASLGFALLSAASVLGAVIVHVVQVQANGRSGRHEPTR